MKIVILDGYSVNPGDMSWDALAAFGEVTVYPRTAPSEIVERCAEAEMVLTNKVPFDKDTIAQLPALQYIGVLATGYNIIDTVEAAARGIVVTNIPAYSTDSVAQMVFAHLLNITNRVGYYAEQNRNGRWSGSADFCYWAAQAIAEAEGITVSDPEVRAEYRRLSAAQNLSEDDLLLRIPPQAMTAALTAQKVQSFLLENACVTTVQDPPENLATSEV